MKKRIVLVLSMLLLFSMAFGKTLAVAGESGLKPIAAYDRGSLYKARKFNVIELRGNFREMGRQYGHLLKVDLRKFYELAIADTLIKEKHLEYGVAKQRIIKYFKQKGE